MATIWPRVASATQWPHLFLSVGLEGLLLAAVVVGHGDDREDHVDQVERAEEDDQHEEDHLVLAVRLDRLAGTTATTAHTQHAVSQAVWRLGMRLETVKCTSVRPSVCLSVCMSGWSTAAATCAGFAAEFRRGQQISIDSCRRRDTRQA